MKIENYSGRAVAVGPVAVEVALHRVDAAQKLLALLRLGHRHGADVTVDQRALRKG